MSSLSWYTYAWCAVVCVACSYPALACVTQPEQKQKQLSVSGRTFGSVRDLSFEPALGNRNRFLVDRLACSRLNLWNHSATDTRARCACRSQIVYSSMFVSEKVRSVSRRATRLEQCTVSLCCSMYSTTATSPHGAQSQYLFAHCQSLNATKQESGAWLVSQRQEASLRRPHRPPLAVVPAAVVALPPPLPTAHRPPWLPAAAAVRKRCRLPRQRPPQRPRRRAR